MNSQQYNKDSIYMVIGLSNSTYDENHYWNGFSFLPEKYQKVLRRIRYLFNISDDSIALVFQGISIHFIMCKLMSDRYPISVALKNKKKMSAIFPFNPKSIPKDIDKSWMYPADKEDLEAIIDSIYKAVCDYGVEKCIDHIRQNS